MDLIEDSKNLSETGKGVCTTLMILGVVFIMYLIYLLSTVPAIFIKNNEEIKNKSLSQSKPEEITIIIPEYTKPKSDAERYGKKIDLTTKLSEIQGEANNQNATEMLPTDTIEEIVAFAVVKGKVHPLDADNLLKESKELGAKKTGQGWDTQDKDTLEKK